MGEGYGEGRWEKKSEEEARGRRQLTGAHAFAGDGGTGRERAGDGGVHGKVSTANVFRSIFFDFGLLSPPPSLLSLCSSSPLCLWGLMNYPLFFSEKLNYQVFVLLILTLIKKIKK